MVRVMAVMEVMPSQEAASVINKGTFAGGNGGAAYGYGYDGYGGNAITGDNLSIINNGAILGGNGGHWGML